MKLKIKMRVMPSEMYNFFIENFKKEMNFDGELKEGMRFEKKLNTKFNKSIKSYLEINTLKENKEYSLKYISPLGINYVSYKIEKLDDKSINLFILEEYQSNSFFNKLNNTIMEFIYSYFIKKEKKKVFKKIEEYIINKRGGCKND